MPSQKALSTDIAIIGAGPIGLAFAKNLAQSGLSITLIEHQPIEKLATPLPDGRDIAITHETQKILESLGIWQNIPSDHIHPLRRAIVLNARDLYELRFCPEEGAAPLGFLIPNHMIRMASWRALQKEGKVKIIAKKNVVHVETNNLFGLIRLEDGQEIKAQMLVSADSRLSKTRDMLGIKTQKVPFGKTALLCTVEHGRDHLETAFECFAMNEVTVAYLPLQAHTSSIVLTIPSEKIDDYLKLSSQKLCLFIESASNGVLGKLKEVGSRYHYPLIATYAKNFCAQRYALLGDAAVGMHPVTAHGYNLGIQGQNILAREIMAAQDRGRDWTSDNVLRHYERAHKRSSLFMFLGTNSLVHLFTSETRFSLLLRSTLLRLGNRLKFANKAIVHHLTN